jgi:PAS domain-containing protein
VARVRPRIELHVFPSDDAAFRWFAEDELAKLDQPEPMRLQRALRVCYPLAVVRVRSELAQLPEDGPTWYAFRRAVAQPPLEHWWLRQDAWARLDLHRTILDASERFAIIVEVPRTSLIGKHIEDLANPADPTAVADVTALWTQLLDRGEAHGSVRFNRLDGSPRELEYHVVADLPPQAGFRAVIRERP